MNFIQLTKENLEKEHICCAISNNKDIQVSSKKAWLNERLEEGLVFLKADVRGKCFIEYIPAQYAWAPIEADSYMYINCLWVSGQFKGQGLSSELLNKCIEDSKQKGFEGLVILSSKKKMGFLADPKYLKYKGFMIADTASPYFELWYLPFNENAKPPKFKSCVKKTKQEKGLTIYYTNQCPFTAKYVPILENIAKEKNVNTKIIHIQDLKTAKDNPCPLTTFSIFYDGSFITHEIQSEKKFEKLLEGLTT